MKQQLLDTLEQIAGKENIHPNEPMSRHTTFRVGGPADVLVTPEAEKQLPVHAGRRESHITLSETAVTSWWEMVVSVGWSFLPETGWMRFRQTACGLRREREHSCHARRRLLRHMR